MRGMDIYRCLHVGLKAADSGVPWGIIEPLVLSDVVTGAAPRLRTTVKACWTDTDLWIRFECEDDYVVATMREHDAPLYLEDVVEIFLDETGQGTSYVELEINPLNAVFDAIIQNDPSGKKEVDLSWHAVNMVTCVEDHGSEKHYEIRLPLANFRRLPADGTVWRWNAYRIDDDRGGTRHYWAWRPTGKVDFHRPECFGTLVFVKE
ncbi:carbohydrate-binding family 9-like protein [Paenibacillus sp. R14(2021)]|uniref:carbohydrate-binding family 9-like protein n=1 Tax=Paenibacillus sp. R14(2021) TaxID=2859228 RepID=UPI001C614CC8|nr:carbohydrate-binding family 9-like protein [Paenibacillus sp. R14(2021)]